MPEIHIPKLDEHDEEKPDNVAAAPGRSSSRTRSILKLVLEVALISVGVFLGLAGEQWRERREHRELADAAIRRFRTELTANRAAVAEVVDYHHELAAQIRAHLAAKGDERRNTPVHLMGIRFAAFEHTAWDLALATQSLSYIDPDLAYAISHVYVAQGSLADLAQGITHAMYLQPPGMNTEAFLHALNVYYGDANVYEPALIKMYDDLLPRLGD